MYQFIETVCYEQGSFQRIELHNQRCNQTRSHFFGKLPDIKLELLLTVPWNLMDQTVKCTVTYGIDIVSIEYSLYQIRSVTSLQMVVNDSIDYRFKYADRSELANLYQNRGQFDDILIIKDGFITDMSYANTIYSHNNLWYSPKNPLLMGTRLRSYLAEGRVAPALLCPKDLRFFSEARIINAMISIENSPVIPIASILF